MQSPLSTIRIIFLFLCVCSAYFYTLTSSASQPSWDYLLSSAMLGLVGGGLLIGLETTLKKFNLKTLNTLIIGLFVGYLLSQAVLSLFSSAIATSFNEDKVSLAQLIIVITCSYLGLILTAKAADEVMISIPFIKLKQGKNKKRDILADASVLSDARVIDLAASGLLDHHLIIPRHLIKEIQDQAEGIDEMAKNQSRRSLEIIHKLEALPGLNLRYTDTDFQELKDPMGRLVRIARFLEANILTADINRVQQASIEGVKIINIHSLSNSLKPLMTTGETIDIKVQRPGKEPRQGVGYLEDGTMVVVNGGGMFIGQTIKTQVLSVKHTSSGRMIFCNAAEESDYSNQHEQHYTSLTPRDLSTL